ncbi:uncharacterized protein BJ212DRAFT_1295715 [Suillus subaureus]|uniref:Uncharacterized protein n=1 Tax=Suillus subaureus TaxID=48587 RepID=A0A9P7JIF8_9AGAM|nr:uncharacterized protein BJ212DRAFT_1295715 [Suillus subaureus]KAG1824576.1 hypothetical protein BJ212DRAFT_1295715 [Suillus subaureus]
MSMITWLNSPQQSKQGIGTLQDHIKIRQWHHFDYNKLKTPYKPLIKWHDMESTILGKHPAKDLPPAVRTVDSDLDLEDEFDDGIDWLDGPAAPSQFKTVEKDSFVLAASSSINLCVPYLHELLDSIGKQPVHPGSGPTKKAAAKNLSSSVPNPSAWDEWK